MIRVALLILLLPVVVTAQSREEKVRQDKRKVLADGFWIYNDISKAFEVAKRNGKPIVVVLRCLPCEECVKLDDDLVENDPVIRPLLEQFVRVRQVYTNGLDLGLFQFDTDQSFAVFMLNADEVIYGRYGTRSHRTEWQGDVSRDGLAEALKGALELHAGYPANRASLRGKHGPAPTFASPEKYPSLMDRFTDTVNYEGDVVKSCIHCHQIGDAERMLYRAQGKAIPERDLYPYPHPKSIGLILDPDERATVLDVRSHSAAEVAGFQARDEILSISGQPPLSIADFQWVLHQADPQGDTLSAIIERDGEQRELSLKLDPNWRRADDTSWRVSTWGLRRMALGGLVLESLTDRERDDIGIASGEMALRIRHVGQYGDHAAAKRAGFQEGDVITQFDGRTDLTTEADVLRYGVTELRPDERVEVEFIRLGARRTLTLPMQK